jgi:hypothetical protein
MIEFEMAQSLWDLVFGQWPVSTSSAHFEPAELIR